MPSWLKGVAKRGKRYGRTEEERRDVNDPFSDLEFNNDGNSNLIRSSSITESYHDGIAPVVIQIDEAIDDEEEQESLLQHRDERQPRVRKREWEQRSHRSIDFAGRTTNGGGRREKQKSSSGAYNNNSGSIDDSSSSTKPSKKAKQSTGTGEPSSGTDCDLEHCCLAEGACLGNAARGETNDDVGDERTEELPVASTTAPGVASSFKNADACIQQIRSAKSRPDPTDDCEATAGTQYSQQQLDTIRELGPIRDKNADQKDRHTFMVKRLYVVVAVACLLLITTIIAVTVAVKRKKANRADLSPSARRSQMKESMVSELNKDSDFETEGSAQNLALDWMANDDPAALPATPVTTELTERFAAATLYFATGGPQEWIDSFGFLSGASICEWNSSGDNTLARIGIFCGESGAVREVKLGKIEN
ncbi:unnamed protein product [Pseudo-nitzschia multistriata]|uniref:Uncharacterized protein n=1 Tax=Pseudo-nitzschia multistriata TaxID=183589 RepID=A0A448Z2S2_9STRA|nr:unnamed protein product [Pseudo-nitzschia multistriata]